MSKLILLNGPKECGKNVAVDHLKKHFPLVDRRCKDHLFTLTKDFFKLTDRHFTEIYNDRTLKEVPLPEFMVTNEAALRLYQVTGKDYLYNATTNWCQLSVRDALIYVSECICKPTFGKDYFGQARADSIGDDELAIDDSCGFDDEIKPSIDKLGEDNVLLIRIHGRGSFDGDSRNFIADDVVPKTIDIWNSGPEEVYLDQVLTIADMFYKSRPFGFVERGRL